MPTEEWTTIVFRNGVRLELPQATMNVIAQMAAHKSLCLFSLGLRDGARALVSAPDIVAVAASALAAEGNMSMLQSTRMVLNDADRVLEHKRDNNGEIVSTTSRVVRGLK